jgi:hypothetical protein
MAINRDPTEWFDRHDRMDDVVYGVLETAGRWKVLKKEWRAQYPSVSEIAQVDSRKAAIGFIKLLVEK